MAVTYVKVWKRPEIETMRNTVKYMPASTRRADQYTVSDRDPAQPSPAQHAAYHAWQRRAVHNADGNSAVACTEPVANTGSSVACDPWQ